MTALKGPSIGASGWPGIEEAGEDANADLLLADALGHPEQLQRQAELLRVGEVIGTDPLDALVGDVVQRHRRPEREPRQDRHLRRGVGTADVVGGIGLGVAELLGLLQRLVVGEARPAHLGEDVVGGAVDDPEHLLDRDRAQALLNDPDHGDRPGDGGLEAKLGAALLCGRDQLLPVLGDQLLVGGDHMAPLPQGAGHVLPGRIDAPDQLDDHVAGGENLVEVALLAPQHADDLGAAPGDLLDHLGPVGDQLRERRAHGALAEHPDQDLVAHASRESRSSQDSRRTTTRASPSRQKTTGGRGTPL